MGISFYILVPDGQNRYCQFLFYHHHIAENTAGCRTRQACPYVCDYFWLSLFFPAFKPTCLPLPCRAMANKSVFRQCAAGGTPVTASHAHMTMTVTGLPSRWQESGAFPLYRCAAPCLFPWRVAPSYPLPFPFRLYIYASVSMPPSGQHQCVIFVAGAKVISGQYAAARSSRLRLSGKISTLTSSGSILSDKPCII